jgi:hypothetical protein
MASRSCLRVAAVISVSRCLRACQSCLHALARGSAAPRLLAPQISLRAGR